MPRRKKPRARGQIRSRGLDKWLVRVFVGTDPITGSRKYSSKTVTGPKRDAERKLTEMLHEIDTGNFIEPSKLTVSEFVDRWLDQKTDVTPGTLECYARRVRLDIKPYIGHMKLEDVHQTHLSNLFNKTLLKDRGHSGRTIQYASSILKQAFEQAVEWGIVKKNPVTAVTLPSRDKKKIETLTPSQVQTLLSRTSGTTYGTLWMLLLTTGCRPQEACALKWSDITEDTIIIRRAMKRSKNRWSPKDYGKTKKAMRQVRIPQGTQEALKKHRVSQLELALKMGQKFDRDSEWVFAQDNGSHLQYKRVWVRWKAALEKLELPDRRLYDTRHTHATTLLMRGVPVKVVSERLGHANTSITMDMYMEVLPEMQEEAANEIEQAFFAPALAV